MKKLNKGPNQNKKWDTEPNRNKNNTNMGYRTDSKWKKGLPVPTEPNQIENVGHGYESVWQSDIRKLIKCPGSATLVPTGGGGGGGCEKS